MKGSELVIIGAGPAGIIAAVEAVQAGLTVTLLDENINVGGQIYRQYDEGFTVTEPDIVGQDHQRGQRLFDQYNAIRSNIEYWNESLVWGLFDNNEIAFQRHDTSHSLRYQKLIVATGAYDRPSPFPGWTLPGVFTAGGAQRLVKMQRVLPGRRILLAGTGPLQLVLADQIIAAGGTIEAILEAGTITNWPHFLWGMWGQWELLADGWHYWRSIRRAKVPLMRRHLILEAKGDGQVEEAVIAEADNNWRPKPHTQRNLKVDAICLGYGLVPSAELTLLAGCGHWYEPLLGGWVPVRKLTMETTVPGVYVVGDGSGVAGNLVAIEEGRIAAVSIARSLGHITQGEARERLSRAKRRLNRLIRFRRVLDEISVPRAGLFELARDDTVVCRCEEVTLREIKEALAHGYTDINQVKRMTRTGMGRCQGRMCMPAVLEIIRRHHDPEAPVSHYMTPRPPVKPISLGTLSHHRVVE